MLLWYQHRDGVEKVRAVTRVEVDGELGLQHHTNGTFSPCIRPVSSS